MANTMNKKNKNNQIKQILEEIYLLDPSLKKQEENLENLLKNLISSKPEVEIDTQFKEELKQELLQQAKQIKTEEVEVSKLGGIFAGKLPYALSGAVFSLLIVAGGVYYAYQAGYFSKDSEIKLSGNVRVDSVSKERAFGSLAGGEEVKATGGAEAETAEGVGAGIMGTGGGSPQIAPRPGERKTYHYIYDGELNLDKDKVKVLKRTKGNLNDSAMSGLVKSLNFDSINLQSFNNSQVRNISFEQKGDNGYSVFVDLKNESVSINTNWRNWTEDKKPLTAADLPSEDKIIGVADEFIKKHGISLKAYGEPELKDDRRYRIMSSSEQKEIHIPHNLRVVYPLKLNGKTVYDRGGHEFGMTVMVEVRKMKVSGVYNLTTHNYRSSVYEAIQDKQKLLEAVEKGGLNRYFDEGGERVDVTLGDPELAYMKHNISKNGEVSELLVPAMVFPIEEKPSDSRIYQDNIIVPLAKELFKENNNPRPRPMME
jgi:hypothetical protein